MRGLPLAVAPSSRNLSQLAALFGFGLTKPKLYDRKRQVVTSADNRRAATCSRTLAMRRPRRRRFIVACSADREQVRAVERLLATAAAAGGLHLVRQARRGWFA